MGIEDEPADVGFLEDLLDSLGVGALGKPDAAGIDAEPLAVMVAGGQDLGTKRGGMVSEQRQQRVRGGAGDDFELTPFLALAESAEEITVP
jgi:hypothetical protein